MELNWANRVTIIRILLIIPFVGCMLKINDPEFNEQMQNTMRYISIFIFLVMAASDVLDGYLARRNGQVTSLGAFLDPLADKLLMTAACLLLASQRAQVPGFPLPITVVVLIIGKDLFLLMGFIITYLITNEGNIIPEKIGKVATALQLSMVTAILLAPEISTIIPSWIWFLRVLWWSAAATAILTTLIYTRTGSRYIEEFERNLKNNA